MLLEAIRKRTGSIVVKVLLGLLILSFGLWGIGDYVGGVSTARSVADIGDVEISPAEFQNEVRRELNRYRMVLGDRFTFEQAETLGIVDAVLRKLISQTLFHLGAEGLDVTVGDDEVRKRITGDEAFQGAVGGFDRARMLSALQTMGLSEDQYIALVRDQVARDQLVGSVAAGARVPDRLAERIFRHRKERRVAETVLIADAAVTGLPEPDPAALEQYHRDHATRYTAPEFRALTVIRLDAADLAEEIAVSDTELREAFEAREDEFNTPERRAVEQMIFEDEETARRAREQLLRGRAFAAVAREVANMDADGIDLGSVTREEMLPEVAAAVFTLGAGAISAPVASPLGWHILRIGAVERERRKSLDEVRDSLAEEIAMERATDGLYELANRLEDALGGGATLEEAGGRLNLGLVRIAAIGPKGRDRDGKPIADLPRGQFLTVAFETGAGEESTLIEAGSDGYFILRVDAITAPELRPFATVRGRVADDWTEERRRDRAKELAEHVLERARSGASLDALAAEVGGELTVTPPFDRTQAGLSERAARWARRPHLRAAPG